MKTIGLIGGISWVSSAEYYRIINEEINKQLGGIEFAQCILYSLNYADIKRLTDAGDIDSLCNKLTAVAVRLAAAGADCILIGANTMHMLADKVQAAVHVPVLHIAEITAKAVRERNLNKVGLLGTRPTMEKDFYRDKLAAKSIETLVPEAEDREFIHQTIFEELGKGILKAETRQRYLEIMQKLEQRGAQGIILGCTEIPLLIRQEDFVLPVFDTTRLHAEAGVEFALS
jgi:aspartate racemase